MGKIYCNVSLIAWLAFAPLASNAQPTADVDQRRINYDSLRIELEAMFDSDQKIRRIVVDSIGLDSPEIGKYLYQMATIDIQNKARIKSILEKYGWIEQSKIGTRAAEGIFYLVQHTDLWKNVFLSSKSSQTLAKQIRCDVP